MSAGSHNPVHLEFPHGGFVTLTIKGGFDSEAAYWFSYGLWRHLRSGCTPSHRLAHILPPARTVLWR